MKQSDLFAIIANDLRRITDEKSKPVRVAINGIEGTGKTTFASALVGYLNVHDVSAHHISIDGFHFNKEARYQQGRDSADGYYEDSYDELGFVRQVLLRSQNSPSDYVAATHDLDTDGYLDLPPTSLDDDAVLVTDGCYLFKPVFNDHWDFRIYLKTDFETALKRGVGRDQAALGGLEAARHKFKQRYHAASKRYIAEVNPENLADMIIDMTDFDDLSILAKPTLQR